MEGGMSKTSSFRGYLVIIALVVVSYLLVSSVLKSMRPAESKVLTLEPRSAEAEAPAQEKQDNGPKEPEAPQVWQGAM
jgi:hypothetical protein